MGDKVRERERKSIMNRNYYKRMHYNNITFSLLQHNKGVIVLRSHNAKISFNEKLSSEPLTINVSIIQYVARIPPNNPIQMF